MTDVWVNGRLLPEDQAVVGALGDGVQAGRGVFESMQVVRGRAFARTRHLIRLCRSAEIVGLAPPDRSTMADALDQVLERDSGATKIRITVLAGRAANDSPTTIVHTEQRRDWPAVARAVTSPWVRNERSALAGAKTTSYAENLAARRFALDHGADEALLFDTRGFLSEGTASNVFVEVDGRLCTPAPANGCLAGVTAELVGELVDVDVCDHLDAGDLAATSEAFLTSSTRDVHPLAVIDDRALPAPPGPLTRAAAEAFDALVQRDDDP